MGGSEPTARLMVGSACIIAAPALWHAPLAVVDDVVVSPWMLVVLATVAGLVVARDAFRRGVLWRVAALLVIVAGLFLSFIPTFGALTTSSHVLPEKGRGWCRIVVSEGSFVWSGSGTVGTVSTPIGLVDVQATYDADDGGMPFTYDPYSVRWEGSTAVVSAPGSANDPAWPPEHHVSC